MVILAQAENNKLMAVAQKAALLELYEMAKIALPERAYRRFEYSEHLWHSWTKYRDNSIFSLMPSSLMAKPYSSRSSGVFAGLGMNEIVELCFESDAIDFIIKHSCNEYLFWQYILNVVSVPLTSSTKTHNFPLKVDDVKNALLKGKTPFGVVSSSYNDAHVQTLKDRMSLMKDKFDPELFEPNYAVFLLMHSLLLQEERPNDFRQIPKLVLNPIWSDFIADLMTQVTNSAAKAST